MNTSAESVHFDDHTLWVELSDGRVIGAPLAWLPRPLDAGPADRERCEIGEFGIHWSDLDEDISVDGLLAGNGDQTRSRLSL